jgi:hypothetical protein
MWTRHLIASSDEPVSQVSRPLEWCRAQAENGNVSRKRSTGGRPRWSPDGHTLYFISNHMTAFFKVWGMRFDPVDSKATSESFR